MTNHANEGEKALFIPLKGKYYDAFASAEKTSEYRAYGPRWNNKTCYSGRKVVLSRGYGKAHRMNAVISLAEIVPPTPDFLAIYGDGKQCLRIRLIVDYTEGATHADK